MSQLQSFYQIEIVPFPVLRNEEWMTFPSMLYILTSVPLPSIGVLLSLKNQSSEGEGDRRELACRQDALSVLIISGYVGIYLVLVDFLFSSVVSLF